MSIAYSTAIQDKVAYRIYNTAYSTLTTAQKTKIDGAVTPPADPGGVVGEALDQVQAYSQYFVLAGSESAPPQWEHWLVAESSYLLALTEKPQAEDELDKARERARSRAMESFSLLQISDASESSGFSLSLTSLRRSCIIRAVRRKDRFFPQVESIDEAIHEAINELWTKDWYFTRQQVTATLATSGVVTVNMSDSEAFEYVLSQRWYYENTAGDNGVFDRGHEGALSWADSDHMAALKASDLDAGRPRFFRITQAGTTKTWILDRTPDQEYTIYGEVKFRMPTMDSPDDVNTVLTHFPDNFKPILRDLVWSKVLADYGIAGEARELEDKVNLKIERELPQLDDQGNADEPLQVTDVYMDRAAQHGSAFWSGM